MAGASEWRHKSGVVTRGRGYSTLPHLGGLSDTTKYTTLLARTPSMYLGRLLEILPTLNLGVATRKAGIFGRVHSSLAVRPSSGFHGAVAVRAFCVDTDFRCNQAPSRRNRPVSNHPDARLE